MKVLKVIFNWVFFIAIVFGCWYAWHNRSLHWPVFPIMQGYQVILFAFSVAFVHVEVLKWGRVKPFNCVKCLTGWFSLILAFCFHTPFWYFYLFIGLFVGALYSALKMRYL